MVGCSSPPKKKSKLSLKFMRKERPHLTDDDEGDSGFVSQKSGSARTRHNSAPNGQCSATGSTANADPFAAPASSSKDNQLEVMRSPPPPFAGLQNLGNTCYLNSVLQALRFCPGFCQGLCKLTSLWEQVREEARIEEGDGDGDNDRYGCGQKMQFVVNLKRLYDKMSTKEADYMASPSSDVSISLSPDDVLETVRELNPMFQGFLQHDSQELLCCLLSYVLDACQHLKKQLMKLHPPYLEHCEDAKEPLADLMPVDEHNSVDGDASKNRMFAGRKNESAGKCMTSGEKCEDPLRESSNMMSPVGDMPHVNGKSGKLDVNSSTDNPKDNTVCENSNTTPGMKNGKKTPRRRSQTPSSDSVVGRKVRTPSSVNGKTNGDLVNGFGDHPRTTDPDGKKTPGNEKSHGSQDGSEMPCSNGSAQQHETSAKKKRLGKFRVPPNQTTLLTAFASLKKEVVPPNGIRTDLPANAYKAQTNGTDSEFKSDMKCSGVTESSGQVTNSQVIQPNKTESENEPNSNCNDTSPTLNGTGDAKVKRKSSSKEPVVSKLPDKPSKKNVTIDSEAMDVATPSQTDRTERELQLIQGLFQGALVLRTRCNECESYTERREEFQDISLPVRSVSRSAGEDEDTGVPGVSPADLSLSWAISEFACVERLTDDNKYFCEHCRHHAEAERSMLFGELPPVLTIHLKRFSTLAGFLTADSTVSKINDHLATPLSLRLGQWCAKQCKELHSTYDLCAVVMHSGVSSSSGHYISYVRLPDRPLVPPSDQDEEGDSASGEPRWGKFDDEKVSVLTQQELASSVLHPVSSSGSAATPYLLFYRQVQESD